MIVPYFVLVPLGAAFLICLVGRTGHRLPAALAMASGVVLFSLALVSYVLVERSGGRIVLATGGWEVPWTIGFVLDYLSSYLLVTIGLIAVAALVYSPAYMARYTDPWKYYALFQLLLAGMNGVVLTGDFFNLFVFMEITLLAAYALVGYGCEAEELEAAFKYTVMGAVTSTMILLGIGLVYALASSLNMADVGQRLYGYRGPVLYLVYGLLFTGFGLKAALMPFHAWLPDAHPSAPAPISAMLSGVLIKVLGVYPLIRIFYHVFPAPAPILHVFRLLGAVTILGGVLMARAQFDLKRLLAFHSVSQIGYIVLGLGLGTFWGLLGAIFHLLNHAIFKALLFLNAGSIEYGLGTRDLREMGELAKKMKPTAVTSMVASLSISGIPPFNGFFSKLLLILAAIQAGRPGYAVAAALGSILTLASFLKVQRYAFYGAAARKREPAPVPRSMNLAMVFLAVLCLLSVALVLPGVKELTLDKVAGSLFAYREYWQIIPGGRP
ncbi:MAG: NADH/ubiquinone/plastoquinone (complex I) [Firmicutes bacterium]|nr:NADH/ubiquinone/plastoquinone (complex I) [Bacillota bacterium]